MKGYSAKIIVCKRCGITFNRLHSAQRFCFPCKPLAAQETVRRKERAYRDRNRGNPLHRSKNTQRNRDYVQRNQDRANLYQREYSRKNADKKKEAARQWRLANPEKYKAGRRRYYEKNAAVIAERNKSEIAKNKRRQREQDRRIADPKFILDGRMSANIRSAIRSAKAGRKWETLVGYNLGDLMLHLERQFTRGMRWENIGDWHIDHIVPKAAFNYSSDDEDDFRACWALTNLRPLWASENCRKWNKRLTLL